MAFHMIYPHEAGGIVSGVFEHLVVQRSNLLFLCASFAINIDREYGCLKQARSASYLEALSESSSFHFFLRLWEVELLYIHAAFPPPLNMTLKFKTF